MLKCRVAIERRFEKNNWGSTELRKLEVTLEGALNDDQGKDRASELFGDIEDNPPSDRLRKACQENMHRAGGKLLDRSKYMPNSPLTD